MALRKLALCGVLIFGLLISAGFTTSMRNVTIHVDGESQELRTRYSDPALILNQAGIELKQKDEFQLKKTETEESIVVYRSVPIEIECEGDTQTIYTTRQSVGEVLADYGYVSEKYKADVADEVKLGAGMHIVVHDLVAEAERAEIARRANHIQTSRGAMRYRGEYDMEATAYLPTDGGGSGITASGMRAQRGVVAVDTRVIPLGTRLYIPGYGEAIAADTGGAIRGHKIDLCMESYGEAIQFGRRMVKVYVLD
ncbi:3D domain-containing protein [Selenomonas sp. TAMA-11512]|uniref:G5 and 3D domain-containing protein n=1 Tax=Selenomonas sp. TAMA-11512 TaxID=3095337 RepID=UPI0030911611|nr:3D domain-containing protein [Selenomonas sp. TAMA-11512]